MEILLIRHGLPLRVESDEPVDPPLAPQGHAQAVALAAWLSDEPPDALVSSTMNRAVETAEHLAERFELSVVTDADFCEFDRGTNAYIPLEELDRNHPHMVKLIDDWVGPGGADKRAVFQHRVVGALDRVVRATDADRLALVCHGGVINMILADVLGRASSMFFEPAYTSISRVSWKAGTFRLRSINERAHLREL